jgi:hypothetical protein
MAEPNRRSSREDDVNTVGGSRPGLGAGPLKTLTNDPFAFSAYNYPDDISNLSHAMLFNINVHEKSKDLVGGPGNTPKREIEAKELVVAGPGGRPVTGPVIPRQQRLTTGRLGLTKKYKRVLRAISLYVPETLVFDNQQTWDTPSLIDKLGILGTAAATALGSDKVKEYLEKSITEMGGNNPSIAMQTLQGSARYALGALTGVGPGLAAALPLIPLVGDFDRKKLTPFIKTFAQLSGMALNPVIEVLYNSPQLRKFNFDFVFSPRSQKEADMVWQIIYEFRRHSAPEFDEATYGVLLVPPSSFDITILRKTPGQDGFIENTNVPRMSTCVLNDVQVDYASSGSFVTFEDGMPIQIRMRLSFTELNIITREMIDKGY